MYNLVEDLSQGLVNASNLKILQLSQPDITTFIKDLLLSLKENCSSLEKLVLADYSLSSALNEFPMESLCALLELEKLQFVYVVSPLMVKKKISQLKKKTKVIVEKRPYFIGRFHESYADNQDQSAATIPLWDVTELPMHYQKLVNGSRNHDMDLNEFF